MWLTQCQTDNCTGYPCAKGYVSSAVCWYTKVFMVSPHPTSPITASRLRTDTLYEHQHPRVTAWSCRTPKLSSEIVRSLFVIQRSGAYHQTLSRMQSLSKLSRADSRRIFFNWLMTFNVLLKSSCLQLTLRWRRFINWLVNNNNNLFKSFWIAVPPTFPSALANSLVSPVNFGIQLTMLQSKSFNKIKNNTGPRPDPCGTPLLISTMT